MWHERRRATLFAACCATLVAFTGCSISSAPWLADAESVAATVKQVSSAVANPCDLLTNTQLHLLGVGEGTRRPVNDIFGAECEWLTRSRTVGGQYLGRIITGAHPAGTPAAAINGLPTAEYSPADLNQQSSCIYLVSVAPNETLWAQYADPSGNPSGVTHEIACNQAQRAASYMASTFGALPG